MSEPTNYTIRRAAPADEPFLWEMLYQSLYKEEGQEPFPRNVVDDSHIARYVQGWGRRGDLGFVVVDAASQQPVGAVWCRLGAENDKGFAYLDEMTPELGMALLPEYRGRGMGTALLKQLLAELKGEYPAISLSVSPNNPAQRLYERLGFSVVEVRGTHPVMVARLE